MSHCNDLCFVLTVKTGQCFGSSANSRCRLCPCMSYLLQIFILTACVTIYGSDVCSYLVIEGTIVCDSDILQVFSQVLHGDAVLDNTLVRFP